MTVYELIQQLSHYKPDASVIVKRSGQARDQQILSVINLSAERRQGQTIDPRILILTDWADSE